MLHLCAMLRIKASTDPGQQDVPWAIRACIGRVALPEGTYGPPQVAIHHGQRWANDPTWGHVTFWGDLAGTVDLQTIRAWWKALLAALESWQDLEIAQGVCQVLVDGKAPLVLDHWSRDLTAHE